MIWNFGLNFGLLEFQFKTNNLFVHYLTVLCVKVSGLLLIEAHEGNVVALCSGRRRRRAAAAFT